MPIDAEPPSEVSSFCLFNPDLAVRAIVYDNEHLAALTCLSALGYTPCEALDRLGLILRTYGSDALSPYVACGPFCLVEYLRATGL